jgi:hypothetical protein
MAGRTTRAPAFSLALYPSEARGTGLVPTQKWGYAQGVCITSGLSGVLAPHVK